MKLDSFQRLLEEYPSKRVGVVGDFILDEYVIGDTKRVSREAPVVVIDYRESVYHPGGAANAVQNVLSLGASTVVCGVVGDDREGQVLVDLLVKKGADVGLLFKDSLAATAVKTRIMAGELNAQRQQIARIDKSGGTTINPEMLERLVSAAETMVDGVDAVLFSDYGLGGAPDLLNRRIIRRCTDRGIPVVVDSRFRLLEFEGATAATPNEVELFEAMKLGHGEDRELAQLAAKVIERQRLAGLIITRGSKGMHVCDSHGRSDRIGIVGSHDATDVTGAGDTVAAAVALSLACGSSLIEAAVMATYAAAVVVMKRGTATVSRSELEAIRDKYSSPRLDTVVDR
ncbi:MAG: PfkB family carbohydrate kinase [Candidatus Krumholzibacteria bacterium]|nr:PfkB family carbohydrate kinase [Candidatus Krumholzibacteria bacterium]